jgi:hypothetical protein
MLIRRLALAGLVVAALGSLPTLAQDSDIAAIYSHPNIELAQFYKSNAEEIEELVAQADSVNDTKARLAAFQALGFKYPLVAEVIARQYVEDSDEKIALVAIEMLRASLVMSDHTHIHGDALSPAVQFVADMHAASTIALRTALDDERKVVRDAAASFLASLSDRPALDLIAAATERGLYTDLEAANLFTLARGPIGQQYVQLYLGSGDDQAQQTAIAYLGFFPEYQEQIRTTYFANRDASVETRAAAAETLSKYDPRFPEYALVVTNEEGVDPLIFSTSLEGYVDVLTKQRRLDAQSAEILKDEVVRFLIDGGPSMNGEVTVQLEELQQRLEVLSSGS